MQQVVLMKWYQAHLRVLSHLFELGLFDEINTSYRNYSIEGTISALDHLRSLVINDDIKLYCDVKKSKKSNENDINASDAVNHYYNATAAFTMFKALLNDSDGKLNKIAITNDMPANYYQVLFEPNGELKDDVVISAFNNHVFAKSPKAFVSNFLSFNLNQYLIDDNFRIPRLKEFGSSNIKLTCKEAQDALTKSKREVLKKASNPKMINYFHIDSKLDSGLGLLKVIDLLGMHLLLVAQRRQYMFDIFRKDDLRSNYKVLTDVNSNDIVCLHNNALSTYIAFEEAQKELLNNKGQDNDLNPLVKSYVAFHNSLYQYLCYFCQLFAALEPHYNCTNAANSWEVGFYYYNLYEPFKHLSYLQAKLLINVDNLIEIDLNNIKVLSDFTSYEQKILSQVVSLIPSSIYDVCAHFAPSFAKAILSHPRLVNFEDIVNSVMSYSHGLNNVAITLPYPIKKGSKYDVEDGGDLGWLQRKDNDVSLESINIKLAEELVNNLEPMVFSRNLNAYFDMFCLISNLVELYNNYYFRTICNATYEFQPGSNYRIAFDLTYCGKDFVQVIYPTYKRLFKDETFKALIECHKACFEHLVVILDLRGETHLLYEDSYMSHWLHYTNNYNQEFADSLAQDNHASDSSDLTKEEQLLLDRTCISYLQDCHKLCQLSKELLNKTTKLDKFLDTKIEDFMSGRNQTLGTLLKLCLNPIAFISQYLTYKLDNVPEDLKLNNVLPSEQGPDAEVEQNYYQCVYETWMAFLAKNMNLFVKENIPYTKLATKEDFAKSLNSVCIVFKKSSEFRSSNFINMMAFKRFWQSYDYDPSIYQQICHNTFFMNNALMGILSKYFQSLKFTIIPMVKYFVRLVLSLSSNKQLDECHDYLNMIYNLVHNSKRLLFTHPAKIKNLTALVEQGNVQLSECFEYQSYFFELVEMFSLFESLWLKYKGTYKELSSIHDVCKISGFLTLYKDLLDNPAKVLQCLDINYFKNFGTTSNEEIPYFNNQDYASISKEYMFNVLDSGEERLSSPQLSVVDHFFGVEIASIIYADDSKFFNNDEQYELSGRRSRSRPREQGITQTNVRFINLVSEKMSLLDYEELQRVLNLDRLTIVNEICESLNLAPTDKSNAKATTTKSKAQKGAATSATKAKADKAADTTKVTESKPKKKATRVKKATRS